MKKRIFCTLLCLAMLLSVSMLASCAVFEMIGIGGKSMDKIVEKIKDLDELRQIVRNSEAVEVWEPHHTAEWENAYQKLLTFLK